MLGAPDEYSLAFRRFAGQAIVDVIVEVEAGVGFGLGMNWHDGVVFIEGIQFERVDIKCSVRSVIGDVISFCSDLKIHDNAFQLGRFDVP